jgi:hypothetical protein
MANQTTTLPPNAPALFESGLQTAPSSIKSVIHESIYTANSILPTNTISMPAQVTPTQVAAQRFEQMSSIVTEELNPSSTGSGATIEHILKSPTHTLVAAWRSPTSTQSESISFQGKTQALCIVLGFITLFVVIGIYFLIRFYYKRFQRARTEAKARAAIADDKCFPKDIGPDSVEPIEEISEYKRSNVPFGLEWQIKAMKEGVPTPTRKLARSASVKQRREDHICSVPDYYFTASPTEPEVEPTPEPAPHKSLVLKEKKKPTRRSFDFGDLAGQTIAGK